MKAAGKVMVVSALVLVLGLAASNVSAAPKSNNSASTDGAIWSANGAVWTANGSQPVNHGNQQEQATRDHGCFSGTMSENARCVAHGLAAKLGNLLDGAIWGYTPPPPK